MQIDPQTIGTDAMYKLMIGCVVPRPIAWVSSVDAAGVPNLAPFSYFMAITHDPPTIAFSASPRAETGNPRAKKDTLRNVEATREFVVNVVDDALAEQMNVTSGDYGPEIEQPRDRADRAPARARRRLRCGQRPARHAPVASGGPPGRPFLHARARDLRDEAPVRELPGADAGPSAR
jgi:flavin reductase (DIM6/NTAB) family NADH-FMN oxidoreductase RutF